MLRPTGNGGSFGGKSISAALWLAHVVCLMLAQSTTAHISVVGASGQDGSEAADGVISTDTILRMRRAMDAHRLPWLPPSALEITLHAGCHRHARGCPPAYATWLGEQVQQLQQARESGSVEAMAGDNIDAADVELRHVALLRERLAELQQEHVHLTALHAAAVAAAAQRCRTANDALRSYGLLHIVASIDDVVSGLTRLANGLRVVGDVWTVWILLRILPCTALAALLSWVFVERHLDPHTIAAAVQQHRQQVASPQRRGDAATAPVVVASLASMVIRRQCLDTILRLQFLTSTSMCILVVFSIASLPAALRTHWLHYALQFLVPTAVLDAATLCTAFAVAASSVGYMMWTVTQSWSALLGSEEASAMERMHGLLQQQHHRDATEGHDGTAAPHLAVVSRFASSS